MTEYFAEIAARKYRDWEITMIEGSMNAEVDTSDDESSIASEEQLQQKQSFGGDVGGTGNDSDEEELEVFSGGSNNEKNHNNLAKKNTKGKGTMHCIILKLLTPLLIIFINYHRKIFLLLSFCTL